MTFDEFVSARLGALVRYATVVTWDPHLAEDITQDVLVKAQARWSQGEAGTPPPQRRVGDSRGRSGGGCTDRGDATGVLRLRR